LKGFVEGKGRTTVLHRSRIGPGEKVKRMSKSEKGKGGSTIRNDYSRAKKGRMLGICALRSSPVLKREAA